MGSLSKFFAEHLDLFTEAFDLDEESNLVEKDHTSAEIVEKLVHDIFVTEMQDILSEFVMPQRRRIVPDDDTGYHHFRVDPAMVNPPMMVTPDLDQMMAQRQAQGGQGQAQTGGQVPARAQAPQAGQAQAPVAGQGGSIPTQIVSILKGRGWSDAAIRGALANAMAEGGLSKTWQQSGAMSNGQRENSFGPWQFNARGELPGYMAYAKQNNIANPQGDIGAITNYMASRVEKMMPNYVKHTDDKTAVDDFHINFERPADKTPGSRYQHLGAANQYFTSAQQQLQQAQQTPQVTGGGQFNLGNRAGNVNQTLLRSVQAGAGYLPAGYQVNVTSGERPGAHVHGGGGPSQHSGGNAIDMQIVGPNGQIISNRGEDTTGMYGRLARASYHELLKSNPDLAGKMAWGGNFTTSANGGDKDLMHIDLGGDRGRFGRLAQQYQQNAKTDNFNAPRTQPQTQVAQNKTPTQPTTAPAQTADNQPSTWSKLAQAAKSIVSPAAPTQQAADQKIAALVDPKQTTPPPTTPPQQTADQKIAALVDPKQTTSPPTTPPPANTTPPANQSQPLNASANPYLRKRHAIRLLRS